MKTKDFMYDGEKKLDLKKVSTNGKEYKLDKQKTIQKTREMLPKLEELQSRLYAEGKEGLLIILQAIDAAGKDSTIKHVMSGINPQGVIVHSFKQPTSAELAHGFLWRIEKAVPERGYIGIMNRSHYEDVLTVKVNKYYKGYNMPKRCIDMDEKEFFKKRYRQINNYEEYLNDNGYRIVKIFLNVSADKQKERFLERIENPAKNWKFSSSDLKERAKWDEYREAFEDAINATATKTAPWYVLPADRKWLTRYIVTKILLETLEDIDPKYPELSKEEKAKLGDYKSALLNEKTE